jgi:hypothetical protein
MEARCARPAVTAFVLGQLRALGDQAAERLAGVPPWRAADLFECAGGPTDTWPGEWLG